MRKKIKKKRDGRQEQDKISQTHTMSHSLNIDIEMVRN